MKKILLVFVALLTLAAIAAAIGFSLAHRGGRRSAGGESTVLVWTLDGPLPDRANSAFPLSGEAEESSLEKLYPILAGARHDRSVKGLAIHLGHPEFGLGRAQEVRRQILAFRQAGKIVECYSDSFGEGSNGTLPYYLASACDKIHLSPAGDLNLLGLYSEARYFRGSLDKLHVTPQFLRSGRYKSAVETYTETAASPEATEALGAVLDSYFSQIVGAIAEGRKRPIDQVRAAVDAAPYSAATALAQGLVDKLSYPDQFYDGFTKRLGRKPRLLAIDDYSPASAFAAGRHIAVVFAQGTILRGGGGSSPFGDESFIASDDLVATLDDLRDDDSCAAVVLRIDSPGGSALASDLILRAVVRLQERKPVIASFSEVAASGGYYIASRASRIVSEPGTLTGSIGVFGGKLVTRELESQLLGVGHSSQKRGANADIYSRLQPFTAEQGARLQSLMDGVYRAFLKHVAEGRHLKLEAVEEIASGRVWTGEAARARGLVDELGGLERAIAVARQQAKIEDGANVALDFLPKPQSFFDRLFQRRRQRLPATLESLVEALEPRRIQALQLPPDLARLARPF